MKTTTKAYSAIAILLLMFGLLMILSSCSKEEEEPEKPSLFGKWEPIDYSIVNEMIGTTETLPIGIYLDFYGDGQVSEVYTVKGDTYNIDTTRYSVRADSLFTTYLDGKYTLTFETLSTKRVVDVNEEGEERYISTLFKRIQ